MLYEVITPAEIVGKLDELSGPLVPVQEIQGLAAPVIDRNLQPPGMDHHQRSIHHWVCCRPDGIIILGGDREPAAQDQAEENW